MSSVPPGGLTDTTPVDDATKLIAYEVTEWNDKMFSIIMIVLIRSNLLWKIR